MNMQPLVSVIMPAYNAQNFIVEAIESVIHQTYKNLELIIVDDGSKDKTYDICRHYSNKYGNITLLRHYHGGNQGVSKSRMLALKKSNGKYVAFCDADDLFLPNKIEIQIAKLEQYNYIAMCHTAIKLKPDSDVNNKQLKAFHPFSQDSMYAYHKQPYFLRHNRICNSTVIVRAELVKSLPFSCSQLFQFEDWLLWVLLSIKGKFLFLNEQLIEYRYHRESSSYLVNRQPLRKHYSFIEFYFLVLIKSPNLAYRLKSLHQLFMTLRRLHSVYKKG